MSMLSACKFLGVHTKQAKTLRSDCVKILKHATLPKPNITRQEKRALHSLVTDNTITILTADKGSAVVVIKSVDYKHKAKKILSDTKTYNVLPKEPMAKYTTTLIKKLQELKQADAITEFDYKRLYPTLSTIPWFYGLPKVHKAGAPLRPWRTVPTWFVSWASANWMRQTCWSRSMWPPCSLVCRRSEHEHDFWQAVPGPYLANTHRHDRRPRQGSPHHLHQNHIVPLRRCHLCPSGRGGHRVAREPYRRQPLYGMVWKVSHPDLPVWDHHLAQIRGWHYGGTVWQPIGWLHSLHQLHPPGNPVHTGKGMWWDHSHARRTYSPISHWPTEFQHLP